MRLYICKFRFLKFDGYTKGYSDFEKNGISLLESIYKEFESFLTEDWVAGPYTQIPEEDDGNYAVVKFVIDLDKVNIWNEQISNYKVIVSSIVSNLILAIRKRFDQYYAPYEITTNKDDSSVNTFYGQANGGGYRFVIKIGNIVFNSPPDVTTTTTTSTTTTTTTLSSSTQTVIPQETSRGDVQPQENKKDLVITPGIVNIFQPSLNPNSISFNLNSPEMIRKEVASGYGFIPVVWYNSYQIDAESIQFLSLHNDGMVPCMDLTFTDTIGIMKDEAFPLDDTKIVVFLNSRSNQLKSIFLQFKIKNFSNNNGVLSIESILDADNLYIKKFKSYPSMSSNKALQEICKDLGLGFNTNVTDTNDSMTWINTGKKPYDFIEEILERSYISDESFMYGYIDNYYNFNFVDIEKEMGRDISEDYGVNSTSLPGIFKSDNEDISKILLTNDFSVNGSNMYFHSFRIINNSTSVSIEGGYTDVIKYYDTNDKSLLKFDINSLNTNGDKSIILKGDPQDESFFKSNQNFVYGGKLDVDNSHKNFNYAKTQNNRNINDAQKVGIEIELSSPNYNLYKFRKIGLILSSNSPTPASAMLNQRLSGDWLVVDIKYRFFNKSLTQIVTLIKRELELSDDELKSELISNRPSGGNRNIGSNDNLRGNYVNPIVVPGLPSYSNSQPGCTKEASKEIDRQSSAVGIEALKKAAKSIGLVSKYAQASLLAIAGGESKWIPQNEDYIYSEKRLKQLFTELTDDQARRATRKGITRVEFFNIIYGEYNPKRIGNITISDGGKYFGRGYIQLTGRSNYEKYAKLSGIDIVNNPNLVNDPILGAKISAIYFKDSVKVNQNDPNYFQNALRAVGKNVKDILAHKTDLYNCLLNRV